MDYPQNETAVLKGSSCVVCASYNIATVYIPRVCNAGHCDAGACNKSMYVPTVVARNSCTTKLWQEKRLTEERLRVREEMLAADPLEAGGDDGDGNDNAKVGGGLRWLSGAGEEDLGEDADY